MHPAPTLSLLDLQRSFRRALLEGEESALAASIVADDVAPAERIGVHRNNVLSSLTSVLKESFPVVCRLVDERFFDYAADAFVRMHPPGRPCLSEYGQDFPDFLASFAPCRDLVYLADVARLEWLIVRAVLAADADPLQPASLRGVAPDDAPRLMFHLQPSHAYLSSPWPIDRIWRANQPGIDMEVDIESAGVLIEVRRHGGDAEMRILPAGDFAFRAALAAGQALALAAEAASAADDKFDATTALARLFNDGAVAAFKIADERGPT